MRNVVGEGGGALHAIVGTLEITGMATLISVPVGLLAAIYLVEYGRGTLARAITFFVDVMTGIPSIVAGLFAYALFALLFDDPGIRFGFGGAIALSLLMIPTVVRSSEEMLKLVPNELREAAYALGVPKWLTIAQGRHPHLHRRHHHRRHARHRAGDRRDRAAAHHRRVHAEHELRPVQRADDGAAAVRLHPVRQPGHGCRSAYLDRAWTGALALILIVMALNLIARLVARIFSPKLGR